MKSSKRAKAYTRSRKKRGASLAIKKRETIRLTFFDPLKGRYLMLAKGIMPEVEIEPTPLTEHEFEPCAFIFWVETNRRFV